MQLIDEKYQVVAKLGVGGQGTVYKARHTLLDEYRALKLIAEEVTDNPEFVDRFRGEAQAMAKFRHEHIVRVHDLITRDGRPYCLVLDFIDGPNLAELLQRRGPLPPADALEIAAQLASALEHAHGFRVWHRDVKPRNVLIQSERPWRVLLTDFGIAKLQDAGERTKTGHALFTPRYSAPEQLGFKRRVGRDRIRVAVDQRTDIFGLGLVLFEMVEGRQFFAGLELPDVMEWVLDPDPRPLTFEHAPPALRAVIERMVARDSAVRQESMTEVLRDLAGCREAIGGAEAADRDPTIVMPVRRAVSPTDSAEFSDDKLEEEIRRLERERLRRDAQRARARAEAARERAIAANVPAMLEERYSEGIAAEGQAMSALEKSRYAEAAELFDALASLLDDAARAASVEAARRQREQERRDAETARESAAVARAAALEARVPLRFGADWASIEATLETAEREMTAEAWAAAGASYADAVRKLDALCDRAVQEARATADRAVSQAEAAHRLADDAGASADAVTLYHRATATLARGRELLAGERFEDAERACLEARGLFDESRAQADQRQRADAERVRAAVAEARAGADRWHGADLARGPYAAAVAAATAGEECLRETRWGAASARLAEAVRLFDDAALAAEQSVRDDLDRVREEAQAAAATANGVGARGAEVDRAARLLTQATDAAGQDDVVVARDLFLRAREEFTRALEIAEEAQRAERKRLAEAAYQAEVEARRAADERRRQEERRRRDEEQRRLEAEHAAEEARREAERAEQQRQVEQARRAEEARREEETRQAEELRRREEEERQAARARAADEKRRAEEARRRAADRAAEQAQRAAAADAARRQEEEEEAEATRIAPSPGVADADRTTLSVAPVDVDATRTALLPDGLAIRDPDQTTEHTRWLDRAEEPAEITSISSVEVSLQPEPPGSRTGLLVGLASAVAVLAAVGLWLRSAREQPPPPVQPPAATEPAPGAAPASEPKAPEPPIAPAPVAPLAWETVSPSAESLRVAEGERQHFGVVVRHDGAGAPVRYQWKIDGVPQGTDSSWDFEPSFTDGGRSRTVEISAEAGGEPITRRWTVEVADVDRPPAIASAKPADANIALDKPGKVALSVEATDPDAEQGDRLTYRWERNGRIVPSAKEPSLTLTDVSAPGADVTVIVSDAGGKEVRRSWQIALAKPPEELKVEGPPRITGQTPKGKSVEVAEGGTVSFGVTADDRGRQLEYVWFVDGREQARGRNWKFRAPTSEQGDGVRVEAEVSDRVTGQSAPRVAWNVTTSTAPPRIVGATPSKRRLQIAPGESVTFGANAVGGPPGSVLQYEWRLDGSALPRTTSGAFDLPRNLEPGEHAVEVASIDERGVRSSAQRWTVGVAKPAPPPPEPPAKPSATTAPEVKPDTPAPTKPAVNDDLDAKPAVAAKSPPEKTSADITEAEVRAWLRRYQQSWEAKSTSSLRELGAISDNVDVEKKVPYHLKVAISNESVTINGGEATVSFTRTDTVVETGQRLDLPPMRFRLRKGPSGVVTARPAS